MIQQLRSIVGFREEDELPLQQEIMQPEASEKEETDTDVAKTRVESLEGLSTRTMNALVNASIRTVGGLSRKTEDDILELEGIGAAGVTEIKDALNKLGVTLKA